MTKTLREKQRQLRADFILDTAYDLMLEQGYSKMSMDELAARVGIAKMTLYQHFSSKEALVVAVIVRGMKQIEDELMPIINSAQPAIDRLRTVLKKGLEQRSKIWRIHLELPPILIIQNEAYQAQNARFLNHWEGLIEQAKSEGAIDASLSTLVLVHMYQSVYQTNYDLLLNSGKVSVDDLIHTLMRVLLDGVSD